MGPAAHRKGKLYCGCPSLSAIISLHLLGSKIEFIRTGVEKWSFMDNSIMKWVFGLLLLEASTCKFFLKNSGVPAEQQSLLQRFPEF